MASPKTCLISPQTIAATQNHGPKSSSKLPVGRARLLPERIAARKDHRSATYYPDIARNASCPCGSGAKSTSAAAASTLPRPLRRLTCLPIQRIGSSGVGEIRSFVEKRVSGQPR